MKKARQFLGLLLVYPQLIWAWVSAIPGRIKGTLFPVVHENVPAEDRVLIDQLGYVNVAVWSSVFLGVAILTMAAFGVV